MSDEVRRVTLVEPPAIEIVVDCVGHGGHGPVWDVEADGQPLLKRCRAPLFESCRALLAQGTPPLARYRMRHRGKVVSFAGRVGNAARFDAHEGQGCFVKYRPPTDRPQGFVGGDSEASEPSEGTEVAGEGQTA